MRDRFNISRIETELNNIIDNKVSHNTFFGTILERETIPNEWLDMCLIESPSGVTDHGAYAQGTFLIWLYARPLSSGRKNVKVMADLERKLNLAISKVTNRDYTLVRNETYTTYDNNIKWHCNVVEVIVKIYN